MKVRMAARKTQTESGQIYIIYIWYVSVSEHILLHRIMCCAVFECLFVFGIYDNNLGFQSVSSAA